MTYRFQTTSVIGPEPLTLVEAKAHLRVASSGDDVYITELIGTARQLFENITGRSIVQQTIKLVADFFPEGTLPWWDGVRQTPLSAFGSRRFDLVRPPNIAVTSFTTYDLGNNAAVFDPTAYIVDASDPDRAGRLILNVGVSWPVQIRDTAGIEVIFTAGYVTLPFWVKQAMRMMVAHMYSNRGDCSDDGLLSSGVMSIIRPYIVVAPSVSAGRDPNLIDGGMYGM